MVAASLDDWANVSQIFGTVGVFLAVLALLLARTQIIKTKKATYGQMTLAVDQALAPYDDIRHRAIDDKWDPPPLDDKSRSELRHRIKQYMGVWERVAHLLAADSIEYDTVERFYAGRVENLLSHKIVRSYVVDKPDDFATFLEFAHRLGHDKPKLMGWVQEMEAEIRANEAAKDSPTGLAGTGAPRS